MATRVTAQQALQLINHQRCDHAIDLTRVRIWKLRPRTLPHTHEFPLGQLGLDPASRELRRFLYGAA